MEKQQVRRRNEAGSPDNDPARTRLGRIIAQLGEGKAVPSSDADALLFDLGRVVIDVDFNRAFSRWAEHARCDQKLISERFRHDTAYERHERGEIESKEFFANLRESLQIDISDAQLLEGWNSILVGEMPGVSELLAKAAENFPLYAFTNSNRAHEQCWSNQFSGILSNFKQVFVSSTIGLRKPEAKAYDFVVREIGLRLLWLLE
jgi:putative hydrolase of the HAD superfamily